MDTLTREAPGLGPTYTLVVTTRAEFRGYGRNAPPAIIKVAGPAGAAGAAVILHSFGAIVAQIAKERRYSLCQLDLGFEWRRRDTELTPTTIIWSALDGHQRTFALPPGSRPSICQT